MPKKEREYDMVVDKVTTNEVVTSSKGRKKVHNLLLKDPLAEDGQGASVRVSSFEPFDGFVHGYAVTVRLDRPQKTLEEVG